MPSDSERPAAADRRDRRIDGGIRSEVARATPDVLQRHYAAKFVVAFVLVLLLIASVGTANYVQAKETVETDQRDQLQSTASLQAGSMQGWVTNMKSQTRTIAVSEGVRAENPNAVRAALFGVRGPGMTSRESLGIVAVHVVDTDNGSVFVTTAGTRVGTPALSEADYPWADAAALTAIPSDEVAVVGSTYVVPPDNEVVAFATEVQSGRYVVVVGRFGREVDQLSQPTDDHTTYVVDAETGEALTSSGDRNLTVDVGGFNTSAGATVGRRGSMLVGVAPIEGADWVLVTTVPTSTAFRVSATVGQYALLVVLVALLALGLVGVALGQQTIPPLVRLREKAERMEGGDLDVALQTGRKDEIGRLYGAFASMRDSLDEQIEAARDAREQAENERARVQRINQDLERTADEYAEVMRAASDGDLTVRIQPDTDNEAMLSIAREFNDMVDELGVTVANLKAFATDVATASEEVTASSEEVRSTSQEVSDSIQQIAEGADRQHEQLRTVQTESNELSATTEEIASLSNEVADLAGRTAETGREGRDAAEAAVEGMDEIEADSVEAVAAIEGLQSEIAAIDELVELITTVTEQTNVLALNANIEAARAGDEAGAGFAVVAEEVKELAEETQAAAADIEERIEDIQEQTDYTATQVQQTRERVRENAEDVQRAIESLEEIAEYATETNTGVQEISAATQQQSSSTERVAAMVGEAAEISEATSDEAENVAAAAEEQTSALDEVTGSMDELSGRAVQLDELLSRFDADESSGATAGEVSPSEPAAE